jgi:hypothetical protein
MKRAHRRTWAIPVLASAVSLLAAGALTLGPAASASAATAHPAAGPAPAQTVVLDCPGMPPLVRPKTFILTCADGYDYVDNLAWTSWTPGLASATGTLVVNDCTPTCVAGHFHRYPVQVVLWRTIRVRNATFEHCYSRMILLYPGRRPPDVPETQTIALLTSLSKPHGG